MAAAEGHHLTITTDFHEALIGAWGSWDPALSPVGDRVAFISDRRGGPELWVQHVPAGDGDPVAPAAVLPVTDEPVTSVAWSADGAWLACTTATGGGVRTQVWAVRPDGTGVRHLAGGEHQHATLGPWTRSGHRLAVTTVGAHAGDDHYCEVVDPETGRRQPLARGRLIEVLDLSVDERFVLLRHGPRGARLCVILDRTNDADHPLLTYPETGSTDTGLLRPGPRGEPALAAYLISDAGLARPELVAVPVGPGGRRGEAGRLAARPDGGLELLDADDAGRLLVLGWNVVGRSIIELLDAATGERRVVGDLPESVVTSAVMARDGRSAALCIEGPSTPRRLWRLDTSDLSLRPMSDLPPLPDREPVVPTLVAFEAYDGLPLTGWLYRAPGAPGPGPVLVSLHGGPEAQERPVFNPQHQAVVGAGISVFAPNVRGSSGFGRAFAHADDRFGRYEAIGDVAASVAHLITAGIADPSVVAVGGRSYGGYLTLAALARFPPLFAAGIDICGMSDLTTFFRDTEPWIAAASVSKYGDPVKDRTLLRELSPLAGAARIAAPVLVVHGEHDTNVPRNEATQIVAALRSAGRPVEYLELEGEGHEYRQASSRLVLLRTMVRFLAGALAVSTPARASAGDDVRIATGG